MEHPAAKLTPRRKRCITTTLKDYSVEQLLGAIDGCRASRFHQGENKDGTVYDDLTLILRSGEYVEKFLAMAGKTSPQLSPEDAGRAYTERRLREVGAK